MHGIVSIHIMSSVAMMAPTLSMTTAAMALMWYMMEGSNSEEKDTPEEAKVNEWNEHKWKSYTRKARTPGISCGVAPSPTTTF